MSWIIAGIIVMLLLLILYLPSRRHHKKSTPIDTTIVPPPKESTGEIGDTGLEDIEEKSPAHGGLPTIEDFPDKHERDTHKNRQKEAIPYGGVGKGTKHPALHDKQGKLDQSILSPFPEDFTPALSFLHEAYRLEEEGENPEKIVIVLEKAREVDPAAVAFYLGRMEIIKSRTTDIG